MSNVNRNPAGIPTGGRFAPSPHDEADISLDVSGPTYEVQDVASKLAAAMDFDHVITITEDGEIEDANGVYAPEISGEEISGGNWEWVDGFSGQYGYSGPVMHASEQIGGGLATHIAENPGTYVAVVVECDHEGCETDPEDVEAGQADCPPAGWGIVHRTEPETEG